MCAINPKYQKHFRLSVYTSHAIDMTEGEFLNLTLDKLLHMEQNLNEDMRLRWHITGEKEKK